MNTERRHDLETAQHIRDALATQNDVGFEQALKTLCAKGVNPSLAKTILYFCYDRRFADQYPHQAVTSTHSTSEDSASPE